MPDSACPWCGDDLGDSAPGTKAYEEALEGHIEECPVYQEEQQA